MSCLRVLLVIAKDHEECPAILQAICDADWEETLIARQLEADRKVGAGDGDDNAVDPLGAIDVNSALGVEALAGTQPDDLELPTGDDEDVADRELTEVGREGRD